MKGLRIIALAFALCIGGTALAQGPQGPQGQQQGQRGPRQRMNPEQMAKMQTERFAKSLDLSEEQQKKLYDYNLNNIKKQQEEREKMRRRIEDSLKVRIARGNTEETFSSKDVAQESDATPSMARGRILALLRKGSLEEVPNETPKRRLLTGPKMGEG